MTVYFLFFFTFYFISIPSFRNKSLEVTFQMDQMRLENEQHREEREHELKTFQLILRNQVAQPIAVQIQIFAARVTTVMKKELISSCETTDIPIVPTLTFIF